MILKAESVLQRLALPTEFGVALLLFSFTLAVAPYFSGADFGAVKIPVLSLTARKRLRIAGPFLLVIAVLLHVPFARTEPAAAAPAASVSDTSATRTDTVTSAVEPAKTTATTTVAPTPRPLDRASRPPSVAGHRNTRVHRVNLLVSHSMSNARVLLDGREAKVLMRTANVIAIEVPAHDANRVITLGLEGREPCTITIAITGNTNLTPPCP